MATYNIYIYYNKISVPIIIKQYNINNIGTHMSNNIVNTKRLIRKKKWNIFYITPTRQKKNYLSNIIIFKNNVIKLIYYCNNNISLGADKCAASRAYTQQHTRQTRLTRIRHTQTLYYDGDDVDTDVRPDKTTCPSSPHAPRTPLPTAAVTTDRWLRRPSPLQQLHRGRRRRQLLLFTSTTEIGHGMGLWGKYVNHDLDWGACSNSPRRCRAHIFTASMLLCLDCMPLLCIGPIAAAYLHCAFHIVLAIFL